MPIAAFAQNKGTLSGMVKNHKTKSSLAYVSIILKQTHNGKFVAGTITNESGLFSLANLTTGNYVLDITYTGYKRKLQPVLIGKLSSFLDAGVIELETDASVLNEVTVTAMQQAEVGIRWIKNLFPSHTTSAREVVLFCRL